MGLADLSCNITLGRNRFVALEPNEKEGEIKVKFLGDAAEMSANEATAISYIATILNHLYANRSIKHCMRLEVPPDAFHVVKCQWKPSGVLEIVDENPPTRFLHCDKPQEAMTRKRNFTCTKMVYECLPKRRKFTV